MSLDLELLQQVRSGSKTPEEALEVMRSHVAEFNGSVDSSFVTALMDLGLAPVLPPDEVEGEEVETVEGESEGEVDMSGEDSGEASLRIDDDYVDGVMAESEPVEEAEDISY